MGAKFKLTAIITGIITKLFHSSNNMVFDSIMINIDEIPYLIFQLIIQ